jgi:hypothetical protein
VQAAAAVVQGIEAMRGDGIGVRSLQDMHAALKKAAQEGPKQEGPKQGGARP